MRNGGVYQRQKLILLLISVIKHQVRAVYKLDHHHLLLVLVELYYHNLEEREVLQLNRGVLPLAGLLRTPPAAVVAVNGVLKCEPRTFLSLSEDVAKCNKRTFYMFLSFLHNLESRLVEKLRFINGV